MGGGKADRAHILAAIFGGADRTLRAAIARRMQDGSQGAAGALKFATECP